MPNGKYVIEDLEFERQIKEKEDRELLEFTAWQSYSTAKLMGDMTTKLNKTSTRCTQNRIGLIVLVATLIALGIIDASLFSIFL